jgi:hypothetical protein
VLWRDCLRQSRPLINPKQPATDALAAIAPSCWPIPPLSCRSAGILGMRCCCCHYSNAALAEPALWDIAQRMPFGINFNAPVAGHRVVAPRARSFNIIGNYSFHAGSCRLSAVILMAAASEDNRPGPMGIGVSYCLRCDDADYHPPRHNSQLLVDRRRQLASGCRLWRPVVRRAEVRRQEHLNSACAARGPALDSGLLDRSSRGRPAFRRAKRSAPHRQQMEAERCSTVILQICIIFFSSINFAV